MQLRHIAKAKMQAINAHTTAGGYPAMLHIGNLLLKVRHGERQHASLLNIALLPVLLQSS